jgi:hypothetical protein
MDEISRPQGFHPECECGRVGPLLDWRYLNWSYTCEQCAEKRALRKAFWKGFWGALTLRPLWDRTWWKL